MKANTKNNVLRLVQAAMLTAISVLLAAFVHISFFPAAPFLEYDMADVPILLGTFLLGPAWGCGILFVTSLIQALTVSAASGPIGFLMHFIASGALVLTAGLFYKKKHTVKSMIIGLVLGSLAMTALMIPLNLIFTVIFLGTPRQAVIKMLIPTIIPFNLIKSFLNSLISGLLYFPLYKALSSSHLLDERPSGKKAVKKEKTD